MEHRVTELVGLRMDRSSSRKRERSLSPTSTSPNNSFKKPQEKRESRQTEKKSKSIESTRKDSVKGQAKITSFKKQTTDNSKMATKTKDQGEKQSDLSLILERIDKLNKDVKDDIKVLDNKMDKVCVKMEERIEVLEGRVFNVEKSHDLIQTEIENVKRKQTLSQEVMSGSEQVAKVSFDKAAANEQFLRNYNLRIFNLDEPPEESIQDCEKKVLQLFKEKLGVDVPLGAIDVIHRVGPKLARPSKINSPSKETKTSTTIDDVNQNLNHTNENKDETENSQSQNKQMPAAQANSENTSKDKPKEETDKENQDYTQLGRPIIVSFLSRRIRREILINRGKLERKRNTKNVMIVEDLTKLNHSLLKKAKEAKGKYESVWSKDGLIYGRQVFNKLRVPIRSFADILAPPEKGIGLSFGMPAVRGRGQGRGRGGNRGRRSLTSSSLTSANPFDGRGLHPNRYGPLGNEADSDTEMNCDDWRNPDDEDLQVD